MKMYLLRSLFLFIFIQIALFSSAQIVGGREPGEIAPVEMKPSELMGDQFTNSVDLFTGSYNGSHVLGSVQTVMGLKFDLALNYSTSKNVGGTEAISKGIPYGDGWNLNVPTVSIKSAAYREYDASYLASKLANPTVDPFVTPSPVAYSEKQGDLYVYSIQVNIPGVTGFNAIYKYESDLGQSVFMPEEFEKYVKVIKMGDNWEVHLEDGTVYSFNKAVRSFRAGSNERGVLNYTEGSGSAIPKAITHTLPKEEYLMWYCTAIRNRNMPRNVISFIYNEYGPFNYFKEFNDQFVIDNYLGQANFIAGSFGFGRYKDFTVYKDLLLKEVVAYNYDGIGDRMELEYETNVIGSKMLNPNAVDVTRIDSLYSKKTVYSTNLGNKFMNWKRYHHAAHNSLSNIPLGAVVNGQVQGIHPKNPYLKKNPSGIFTYNRSTITNNTAGVSFDHSYLESDRLGNEPLEQELIIPGETYEIKTEISGGFGNYDINLVTGTHNNSFESPSLTEIDPNHYTKRVSSSSPTTQPASETIFSTFSSALKWNPGGNTATNNSTSITSSNLFTMPDLPSEYNGFYIQVGPANSDHVFNASEEVVKVSYNSSSGAFQKPSAYKAYNNELAHGGENVLPQNVGHYFAPVPRNFGIGMPWYMMAELVKNMGSGTADYASLDYDFWFKTGNCVGNSAGAYCNYDNVPTLAGNSSLSNVELIRYSKNPYMLSAVKTYKGVGRVQVFRSSDLPQAGDLKLVRHVKLDYDLKSEFPIDEKPYTHGELMDENPDREVYTYTLAAIKNIAADPTLVGLGNNTSETLDTEFKYERYEPTNYDENSTLTSRVFLLSEITNPLGKNTTIDYYPIEDSMLYVTTFELDDEYTNKYLQDPNHELKRRKEALLINPVVKSVSTTIADNATALTNYEYSWDLIATRKKHSQPINTSKFKIATRNYERQGFYQTKVIQPQVNNKRNYTQYTHFSSNGISSASYDHTNHTRQYLGGKVAKVQQFNHDHSLQSETTYEYSQDKAYENGFKRPNDYHNKWDFDYMDYFINNEANELYSRVSLTLFQNKYTSKGVSFSLPDLHYFNAAFPSSAITQSVFVALRKKTEKIVDGSSCVGTLNINNTTSNVNSTPPTHTSGYLNTAGAENDANLSNLINNAEEYASIEETLLSASPLSENTLKVLLEKVSFQEQANFLTVLRAQPGISDSTIKTLLEEPILLERNVFSDFLLDYEPELSEYVLQKMAANLTYVATNVFEQNLVKSSPLSDQMLQNVLSMNGLSESLLENVLLAQPTLSTSIRLNIVEANSSLSINRIENLLLAHEPYPTEAVLEDLVANYSVAAPEHVMTVINASPWIHSSLVETEVQNHALSYATEDLETFNNIQQNGNSNNQYACSGYNYQTLSIETITEYDYYTADHTGITTCDAYRDLFGISNPSFQLKYEPSWQLYKTKTYSPQYPDAYTEQKNYYYFDLQNRYNRSSLSLYPNNSSLSEIELFPDFEDYSYTLLFNNTPIEDDNAGVGSGILKHPTPDGLRNAITYDIRNIAFQTVSIAKNGRNTNPIETSTYYEYTSRWGNQINSVQQLTENLPADFWGPNGCPNGAPLEASGTCENPTIIPNIQVYLNREDPANPFYYFPSATLGYDVYLKHENDVDIFFEVDPALACEYGEEVELIRLGTASSNPNAEITTRPNLLNYQDVIRLSKVSIQIDTLANKSYALAHNAANIQSIYGNNKLLNYVYKDFELPDPKDPFGTVIYNFDYFEPVYPFDVLDQTTILERNDYFYPELVVDQKGQKTRFHYSPYKSIIMVDAACNYNTFRLFDFGSREKPTSIDVYYDETGYNTTTFEYHRDASLKKIIEANGSVVEYKYDEWGRLAEELENGKLINQYAYHYWDKDPSKTFTQRAYENYTESIHFPGATNTPSIITRSFKDPLGRTYQVASGELGNALLTKTLNDAVYSGLVSYDEKGRAIGQQKAFGYKSSNGSFDLLPKNQSDNLTDYPNVWSNMLYEDEWTERVLETADFGETLGGNHTVKNSYSLLDANCLACALELTQAESDLILPKGLAQPYVFSRSTVTDQDGNVTHTYANALGQTVGTKQVGHNQAYITLTAYDNQGNVSLVINPEKQESKYYYNQLGLLYKQETVDGGVSKYMYNKAGNIALQQDEKAMHGKLNPNSSQLEPYVTVYTYDLSGRLLTSGDAFVKKATSPNAAYSPLLYENTTVGDPNNYVTAPYFNYEFTNNSTYSWMANATFTEENITNGNTTYSLQKLPMTKALGQLSNRIINHYENSGGAQLDDLLAPTLTGLRTATNKRGRLAYTLKLKDTDMYPGRTADSIIAISFYNYSRRGDITSLVKQFNPNGITNTSEGIVSAQFYNEFNNDGIARNHMVDIHADGKIDFQNYQIVDSRNRTTALYANITNKKAQGNKIATYQYDNAYNRLVSKNHFYTRNSVPYPIEQVNYSFDLRDRLTRIQSDFMDYELYYDQTQASYTNGYTPGGTMHYNGNINGIKVSYSLSNLESYTSGFDAPTVYNYTYDKLNRLTAADAVVGDIVGNNTPGHSAYNQGDVSYTYDKIGNITSLNRIIGDNNEQQDWGYEYSANTNKLIKVNNLQVGANRNYTYDVAGNLTSDNSRGIVDIKYEQNNLPLSIEKNFNGNDFQVDYMYDANGNRIFKNYRPTSNALLAGLSEMNYYLHDAAGRTVGIFDFAKYEWLWYVNGNDRVATLKPKTQEQPTGYLPAFINAEFLNIGNFSISDFRAALSDYMLQNNPGTEDILISTSLNGAGEEVNTLLTNTAYQSLVNNLPEGDEPPSTQLLLSIASPQDFVNLTDGTSGASYFTSINELYYGSSSTAVPDSSTFWTGLVSNDNGDIILDPDPEPPVSTYTPGKIRFYTYDHLGNTRVMHQARWANNTVKQKLMGAYDYYPYGKVIRKYISDGGFERYLTTGHERDHETISKNTGGTGLDNRGARFYDSDVARFLSLDPAAAEYPSLSDYVYVANNPVIFIDPDGRRFRQTNGGGNDPIIGNMPSFLPSGEVSAILDKGIDLIINSFQFEVKATATVYGGELNAQLGPLHGKVGASVFEGEISTSTEDYLKLSGKAINGSLGIGLSSAELSGELSLVSGEAALTKGMEVKTSLVPFKGEGKATLGKNGFEMNINNSAVIGIGGKVGPVKANTSFNVGNFLEGAGDILKGGIQYIVETGQNLSGE